LVGRPGPKGPVRHFYSSVVSFRIQLSLASTTWKTNKIASAC
jgi:hypothetical protein